MRLMDVDGNYFDIRRVTIELKKPTRDGSDPKPCPGIVLPVLASAPSVSC
jgi:hypothetical protein